MRTLINLSGSFLKATIRIVKTKKNTLKLKKNTLKPIEKALSAYRCSIQLIVVSYLMSCLLLTIPFKHDLNDLVDAIVGIEYNSIQYFIVS